VLPVEFMGRILKFLKGGQIRVSEKVLPRKLKQNVLFLSVHILMLRVAYLSHLWLSFFTLRNEDGAIHVLP